MTSRSSEAISRLRVLVLLISCIVVAAVALSLWWFRLRHEQFDVVLCGERVFDGDKWLGVPCVGIRNGLVVDLGYLQWAPAKRRINGMGLIIAPGFIDLHAHVENNIPAGRPFRAQNFVRMGVTTLVTGNCGTSARDIGRVLDGLDRNGSQVNVATLVGHNTVREAVMRAAPRQASSEEVQIMSSRVEEAMLQGAFGLSTGLAYAPGNHAEEDELLALARAAAKHKGLYATHLRDEGRHGGEALEEALRIGQSAHIPVHISHMKVASRSLWGHAADRLARIDAARSLGMKVTLDAYAYTASSTSLDILMPTEFRGAGVPYRAILQDRVKKKQVISAMLAQLKEDGFEDYSFARVAYFFREHSLEGMVIPDVAVRLGLVSGRAPLELQAEAVLMLLARGGAQMVYFSMNEADVLKILQYPHTAIGTDSSVRSGDLSSVHPRGMGNFPRILGRVVREEGALSIESALNKMTALAADTFGFSDRGRIRVGSPADLTMFDPQTVSDRSTYEHPLEPPSGIEWVFVNGIPVVDPDGPTEANPGRVVRGPGWVRGVPQNP